MRFEILPFYALVVCKCLWDNFGVAGTGPENNDKWTRDEQNRQAYYTCSCGTRAQDGQ